MAVLIGPLLPETTDIAEPVSVSKSRLDRNLQFTAVSRLKARPFPSRREMPLARAHVQYAAIIAAMQARQRMSARASWQGNQQHADRWDEYVDLFFGRDNDIPDNHTDMFARRDATAVEYNWTNYRY